MMQPDERNELYLQARLLWGDGAQLDMVVEECAELIQAVQKVKRCGGAQALYDMVEEAADVEIMLEQLREMYDFGGDRNIFDAAKERKLNRLQGRIRKAKP